MDRRRRDSSVASKSLLSRQLASITDTLAKASQRRNEEMKRVRRPSIASTATTNPASSGKSTAPVQREDPSHGQPTPVTVYLFGDGDEDNSDTHHALRLALCGKIEDVRQERKLFDKIIKGKGPDGPEREKMIGYLLARSNLAKINAQKEVLRARLEAQEGVDEDERIVLRKTEIDESRELMLKEEKGMELKYLEEGLKQWEEERKEDLRMRARNWARSIRSDFLIQTNHAALFKDPQEEIAELSRLEEELFEHLVAQMEAQNAKDLEAATTSRGPQEAFEGNKRFEPAESPDDSAMARSSGEREDGHSMTAISQLRGGEEDDQDAEHHQRPLAAPSEAEEAQRDAPAAAAAAAAAEEGERSRMSKDDYEKMMARKELRKEEHQVRLRRAERRPLREKAGRTSGLASDEEFEHMMAYEGAQDCDRVERLQWLRQQIFRNDTEVAEEAYLDKSVEEELRRRTPLPADERSYLLPPASPPYHSPPSYVASQGEAANDNTSHFDAVMRGGMRGGHATPLDDNPGALLAELATLRETMHLPEVEINGTVPGGDVRQMLAELDRSARSTHAITTAANDPRAMLEELLTLSTSGSQELQSPTSEDVEEDHDDDDINALRARLEGWRTSSARNVTLVPVPAGLAEGRDGTAVLDGLPSEAIPHAVALELELSGCDWAVVQGWTRCLFSSGLDSYRAQKEKEIAVVHAEEALQKTIASVMKVEEENRQKDEETKLQRRLIVSNLAAGADAEEMERQFWQYRSDIVNITMLPDRDPLKRTQTAHVDFSSRKLAVQASFISGQVYGLIFDVKLSVPVE
ncbi:hypothetical protein E8E11_003933 [Didymella keratinophila]|nr:hypothetical protein E8E11_003933 [Didymella keratinophila]